MTQMGHRLFKYILTWSWNIGSRIQDGFRHLFDNKLVHIVCNGFNVASSRSWWVVLFCFFRLWSKDVKGNIEIDHEKVVFYTQTSVCVLSLKPTTFDRNLHVAMNFINLPFKMCLHSVAIHVAHHKAVLNF